MNIDEARKVTQRMVAVTLVMKTQFQPAGFMLARDFARGAGLDSDYVDDVERRFRLDGVPLKRPGMVDAFHLIGRDLR